MSEIISLPIALLIIILAALSFMFSAAETSIIGLSKIRLRHMLAKGIKRAESIHRLLLKSDKFIVSLLIGNNFVNITLSAIVTGIFIRAFGYNLGITIGTFSLTLFVLVFCEITPKVLATKYTEKIALFTAPIMEVFVKIFRPFTPIFIGVSNSILRIFRIAPPKRSPLITEEELRLMIEIGKEEGVLSDEERKMLHRIFEFGDTKVNEVMVPRDKVAAINVDSTTEQLMEFFIEEGHARLPVYKDSLDNIVGVIYTHDLLYLLQNKGLFVLQDLIREAFYAPDNLRVNELLRRFQTHKVQLAIIIDENRKMVGLVTLEDLLEEIVGEIEEDVPRKSG